MKKLFSFVLALTLLLTAAAVSVSGDTGQVADASVMTAAEDVTDGNLLPLFAGSLLDGTYPVSMRSSSSMFKADHCELLVADGRLSVLLYLASSSYLYLYPGSAEDAASADEADYLLPEETEDGMRVFTLPLEALDAPVSCAAYSRKKELWYDRTLLFESSSLPLPAFAEGFITYPGDLALKDGEYSAAVALSGGSGKAFLRSPAKLLVKDGEVLAELVWSSPNYDYMIVGAEKYLPVNTEGNSVFLVPVLCFDHPVSVIADTVAMSTPHEISYSLTVSVPMS
ncbi:MAG: hypothetical protein K6C08_12185 [Oscillospiraceae bacterium]|nr:hypothetical protein [Oscillospiraceae bacterium]